MVDTCKVEVKSNEDSDAYVPQYQPGAAGVGRTPYISLRYWTTSIANGRDPSLDASDAQL